MTKKAINKKAILNQLSDEDIDTIIELGYSPEYEEEPQITNPPIVIGNRTIRNNSTARKGLLGSLNKKRQTERQKLFLKNVETGKDKDKIRIVCEGDSWFNYPTFLQEIIDNIFDDFSIYSLSYGGDWLSNIYYEEAYIEAIRKYRPEIFLISGGGNDMVGHSRIEEILNDYTAGAVAKNLIKQIEFESIIKDFEEIYRAIFIQLQNEFPDLKIICHGYDYPYLGKQEKSWLGKPMKKKGIIDRSIRNEIGKILIDSFNEMLNNLAKDFPKVYYIDLRDKVPRNMWKNELHPDNDGFEIVAQIFRAKIKSI